MANTLSYNDIAMLLTDITQQATGRKVITPVNTYEFVAVAQTALRTGYDTLLNAISQVMNRTLFSIRPYTRKLGGIQVDNIRFGNHVRKLNIADDGFVEDVSMYLEDQESVDMYKINKPNVLQTNFYGAQTYAKQTTIFDNQLDQAFTSPDQLQEFFNMVLMNRSNQIEQAHESLARACIANFIAAKYTADTENVVHLLTEYNAFTGQSLTATSVYQPDNYKAFMQWVYSRVEGISSLLTERTIKFHMNVTGKEISRHTPRNLQKMYMFAPTWFQTQTMALANIFHTGYLRMVDFEVLNFWQSIDTPDEIQVRPSYVDSTGALVNAASDVTVNNIFGIIFDYEAIGYTVVNQRSNNTPFNARGRYSVIWDHFVDRYWNDLTENAVLLLLD